MRNFLLKGSMFLAKHTWLYWVLLFTWGFMMSFIGLIATLVLLPFAKPEKFDRIWHFKLKKGWGGVSLGCMFIRDTTSYYELGYHEEGHTFQNAILGPFMPFVVAIPSMIRYWHREFKYNKKGITPPTAYDDIWFEASATEIGKAVQFIVH